MICLLNRFFSHCNNMSIPFKDNCIKKFKTLKVDIKYYFSQSTWCNLIWSILWAKQTRQKTNLQQSNSLQYIDNDQLGIAFQSILYDHLYQQTIFSSFWCVLFITYSLPLYCIIKDKMHMLNWSYFSYFYNKLWHQNM